MQVLLILLITIVSSGGAPIVDHDRMDTYGQERTFPIHNFMRKMNKLFSLIHFTIMHNLGMSWDKVHKLFYCVYVVVFSLN